MLDELIGDSLTMCLMTHERLAVDLWPNRLPTTATAEIPRAAVI
jgi:hypothetical protein